MSRAIATLIALLATTACSSPLLPTSPTPTAPTTPMCGAGPCASGLPADVRVEGAGGGVCLRVSDLYAQWEVYEPIQAARRVEVIATRAPEPGCTTTTDNPVTIAARGPFQPSDVERSRIFFLREHLTDASGHACGRVRYELRVDGAPAVWLMVDGGRAC